MRTFCRLTLFLAVSAAGSAAAQTPEQIYRDNCSICHDAGTAQAPRLGDRAAWTSRVAGGRALLYRIAIEGKPNTAMAAKGGFAELSDDQTRAAVDYMLHAIGHADLPMAPLAARPTQPAAIASAMAATSGASTTDLSISQALAERLRAALGKPDNRIETYEGVVTLRGVGIKVETRAGVATLSGSVHEAETIRRAGEIAAAMPGVKQVVNRVISAGMLEWD
jgi:cytochrome c5